MIDSFAKLIELAKSRPTIKIAVAAANDLSVLKSLAQACVEGLADSILVGDRSKIESVLREAEIDPGLFEYAHTIGDLQMQARQAVELVASGKAQVLMKGMVDTSILLKELLSETKFRTGRSMSIVGLLEVPTYPKLILATDIGMNINPDLQRKKEIATN